MFSNVPSEKKPRTESCRGVLGESEFRVSERSEGSMTMLAKLEGLTRIFTMVDMPELVAEICAKPLPTAVIKPSEDAVATLDALV